MEVYDPFGHIRTVYTYTPFGEVTATGDVDQSPRGLGGGLDKPEGFAPQGRAADGAAVSQPIQWSGEYSDSELGMVYYNYRHYNPAAGRWGARDLEIRKGYDMYSLYRYLHNGVISDFDILGAAKLVKRPLLFKPKKTCTGREVYTTIRMVDIYSKYGWKSSHSHFVFDDGTNIGFFDDEKLKSDPKNMLGYVDVRVGLDDDVLREAIAQTPPGQYSVLRISIKFIRTESGCYELQFIDPKKDNCNSWADRVLEKYDALMKQKSQN